MSHPRFPSFPGSEDLKIDQGFQCRPGGLRYKPMNKFGRSPVLFSIIATGETGEGTDRCSGRGTMLCPYGFTVITTGSASVTSAQYRPTPPEPHCLTFALTVTVPEPVRRKTTRDFPPTSGRVARVVERS